MSERNDGTVFVISDNPRIIELVEKTLADDRFQIVSSTVPAKVASDFEQSNADVILLAFDAMDKTEASLQLLDKDSNSFKNHECRILTLCNKKEVQRAYNLCRQSKLDNYIVFWPLSFDPPRLGMTLYQAFNELAKYRQAEQKEQERLNQSSQISELGGVLEKLLSAGRSHTSCVEDTVEQTEVDIYDAIASIYDQWQNALKTHTLPEAWTKSPPTGRQIREEFTMVSSALQTIRETTHQFNQLNIEHQSWLNPLIKSDKAVQSILVVDDDEFQRRVIRSILQKEQYQLEFACNGEEALRILTKSLPDLILMDVSMPGVNGIDLTRQITNHINYKHIPIMMVSAHNERNVVLECLKAGAVGFVVKPYNRDTLIAKIIAAFKV